MSTSVTLTAALTGALALGRVFVPVWSQDGGLIEDSPLNVSLETGTGSRSKAGRCARTLYLVYYG